MPTMNEVVEGYLKLRAIKDALVQRQKDELAPITSQMLKLQSYAQKLLQDQGQLNAKTEAGTAFLQTDTSVTVEDFAVMLAFIRGQGLWELLEKRASKSVVLDLIESTKEIPPGIKVTQQVSCHIRKS